MKYRSWGSLFVILVLLTGCNSQQDTVNSNELETLVDYKQQLLAMKHKESVEQLFEDYTKTMQQQGKMGDGVNSDQYELGKWREVVDVEVTGICESETRIFYNVSATVNVELKTKGNHGLEVIGNNNQESMIAHIQNDRQEKEDGINSTDEMRMSCDYRVEIENSDRFNVLSIKPNQDFEWFSIDSSNRTWLTQLPYMEEVPQTLQDQVGLQMKTWIERPEKAFKSEAVYLNPYKDGMMKLETVGYTVTCHERATRNHPVFNVSIEMKVLLKNDKTVYYNYDYIVGLQDESIESIHFINAKPIDK